MSDETNIYYFRDFLNKPHHHGSAFVLADVCVEEWEHKGKKSANLSAEITISDCSRQVTLDFGAHSKKDSDNVRYKIAMFRKVINDFLDAAELGVDEVTE